jgi:ABC-type transport system substrate-binding protein
VLTPLTDRVIFIAILPKGPLKDPRVRQALNYAVDKDAIVNNVLYGLAIPADSVSQQMVVHSLSPPSASQRSPRAPSPQRLTTSRLVAHHPTGLGNSGSPINIATGAYKLSI